MLLFGYRLWPAVLVGAFVVNLTTAGTITTSAVIAIGNTMEAVVGAMLVRRFAVAASPLLNWRRTFSDLPCSP